MPPSILSGEFAFGIPSAQRQATVFFGRNAPRGLRAVRCGPRAARDSSRRSGLPSAAAVTNVVNGVVNAPCEETQFGSTPHDPAARAADYESAAL